MIVIKKIFKVLFKMDANRKSSYIFICLKNNLTWSRMYQYYELFTVIEDVVD